MLALYEFERNRIAALLCGLLLVAVRAAAPAATSPALADPFRLDFRYAPPWWQTAICLPDDWQKTLVGKEGSLLYGYPGKYSGFALRITAGVAGESQWVRQELASPRVPIVRTLLRQGTVEVTEEAFAANPPLAPGKAPGPAAQVERVGSDAVLANWAAPTAPCEPAYRDIAVGYAQSIRYRFRAAPGARYQVVFGLCEGWHPKPGQRILDLRIEGKSRRTVDMVAEKGRNVPALFALPARDENGDGWVDLEVAAAPGSRDNNTILNVLWVLPGDAPVDEDALLAGQSRAPALAHLACGATLANAGPPRNDLVLLRLRNTGIQPAKATPQVAIDSEGPVSVDGPRVMIGPDTFLVATERFEAGTPDRGHSVLRFAELALAPGQEHLLAVGVARGRQVAVAPRAVAQATALREAARKAWERLPLPYGRIQVPDAGVQALIDSSIRNIYQAREIKGGLPAFQVGPTCYRGLWVVDGSFLMESIAMLGRAGEARSGIRYLLSFQRPDGSIMLIDGHWKETGIALWAVARHARLTGDKAWLSSVWPKVEKGVEFIRKMRTMPDVAAPNAGLVPDGFSDGGLAGKVPEYTNVYWTMVGMRAAVEAARWLGKADQAASWQREYEDFMATFRRAAERDMREEDGIRCLPIRMKDTEGVAPQKAQWAFLHAVYPGQLFAPDDPLVLGNMAMLERHEREGLVYGTGWITDGLWNYFGGFYGHAWLWQGRGEKAVTALYAFGNHASPLLCWREEQSPVGGDGICGDMPHNWASAEFIRLVCHLLALERGDELHLCEGLPHAWVVPGSSTRLRGIETEFGPVSLDIGVSKDGRTARVRLSPPRRSPASRVLLHLDGWSAEQGRRLLPTDRASETLVRLR